MCIVFVRYQPRPGSDPIREYFAPVTNPQPSILAQFRTRIRRWATRRQPNHAAFFDQARHGYQTPAPMIYPHRADSPPPYDIELPASLTGTSSSSEHGDCEQTREQGVVEVDGAETAVPSTNVELAEGLAQDGRF